MPSEAPLAARIREIAAELKATRAARTSATVHASPRGEAPLLPSAAGPAAHIGNLIADYQAVLGKLWLLNVPSDSRDPHAYRADAEDARHLLNEVARLVDEIGPEFCAAVSRESARLWAR